MLLDEIEEIDIPKLQHSYKEICIQKSINRQYGDFKDSCLFIIDDDLKFKYSKDCLLRFFKNLQNFYQRRDTLKNRIRSIVTSSDYCFVTLTFKDLDNTSPETRRGYVRKYLSSFGVPFVANIDYGSQNEREHYHAVIGCSELDLTEWREKRGYIQSQKHKMLSEDKDVLQLTKYIMKLTNHALKSSAGFTIYSRNKKSSEKE